MTNHYFYTLVGKGQKYIEDQIREGFLKLIPQLKESVVTDALI